jgi:hypothetical protein
METISHLHDKKISESSVVSALKSFFDIKQEKIQSENPKVFISYSWDNDNHKKWVRDLAEKLIRNGVDVSLDQYKGQIGSNIRLSMEKEIEKADKVLIILTTNFKAKADIRTGAAGYEYSLINEDLYNNIAINEKYFPILREGAEKDSIPKFLRQYKHLDMRNDNDYDENFTILLKSIYNQPILEKPRLGSKPDFLS